MLRAWWRGISQPCLRHICSCIALRRIAGCRSRTSSAIPMRTLAVAVDVDRDQGVGGLPPEVITPSPIGRVIRTAPSSRGSATSSLRARFTIATRFGSPGLLEKYGKGTAERLARAVPLPRCGRCSGSCTMSRSTSTYSVSSSVRSSGGVQMMWIPFWAAGVINGIGHALGYRNFDVKDESRNIAADRHLAWAVRSCTTITTTTRTRPSSLGGGSSRYRLGSTSAILSVRRSRRRSNTRQGSGCRRART